MSFTPTTWVIGDRILSNADHTLLMGVVNVTPDSFSDGGRFDSVDAAVAHGLELARCGADIIDVGGESTRPGAIPIPVEDELARVVPVIADLVDAGLVVSIDTLKPQVAEAAIEAGAQIVNDVTGLADPEMTAICAEADVGVVVMHMQGTPATMQENPIYENVVADVAGFLEQRALEIQTGGVSRDRICIDPGIGFGKTFEHNIELLRNIDWLATSGYPLLVGTSRKGFLGAILRAAGHETSAAERDPATAATVALSVAAGAFAVRVHNVSHALQAARTADAIVRVS